MTDCRKILRNSLPDRQALLDECLSCGSSAIFGSGAKDAEMSSSAYVTVRLFTAILPLFSREILCFSHGFPFA
ncbi:hypothetical protein LZZ85_02480 [Terrimonas sp. NA20]|uniref:Uncharacterized protein n=1 Tax=Terrimonas ginsenosidimutans TaxID=2908004 RepID=A0ABS9KLD5_9BACT|nr:hypothetical protein [Terrimonas ginsenosidimutans]MCG2613121.1 hypothetical protein [Terrimonas ginsenosidimutans]